MLAVALAEDAAPPNPVYTVPWLLVVAPAPALLVLLIVLVIVLVLTLIGFCAPHGCCERQFEEQVELEPQFDTHCCPHS